MIGLFDSNFLLILFDSKARIPTDKQTKQPVADRAQERIDYLVKTFSDKKAKIVLPTPALAEFMLMAENWSDYLTIIRKKAVFEIAGFDELEAVELASYWSKIGKPKLRRSGPDTWAKINYDRQIVAIAQTRRVEVIYSTDGDVHKLAKDVGIRSNDLPDLPLPPPIQLSLDEGRAIDGEKNQGRTVPFPAEFQRSSNGSPEDQAGTEIETKAASSPQTETPTSE